MGRATLACWPVRATKMALSFFWLPGPCPPRSPILTWGQGMRTRPQGPSLRETQLYNQERPQVSYLGTTLQFKRTGLIRLLRTLCHLIQLFLQPGGCFSNRAKLRHPLILDVGAHNNVPKQEWGIEVSPTRGGFLTLFLFFSVVLQDSNTLCPNLTHLWAWGGCKIAGLRTCSEFFTGP